MTLLGLLRVLALVLGMQLSGTGHLAADALSLALPGVAEHEDESCPPDGPCNDCPAGCPQCHCPNAFGSIAMQGGMPFPVTLPVEKASAPHFDAEAPAPPDLPLPFRPPQAEPVVS